VSPAKITKIRPELTLLCVTNTGLLGSAYVLAVGLGTQVVFLYLATPSPFLPALDLLS
jgi:hypothetical protein